MPKADERTVRCPGCQGNEFELALSSEDIAAERRWLTGFYASRGKTNEKDRVDFTQSEDSCLLRCVACGTLTRNPQPTPDALMQRYQSDTYGESVLKTLLTEEQPFYRAKAEELRERLPNHPRVLEIGSFVGAFLDAAADLGWSALGVDVGEETSAFARSQGHSVIVADPLSFVAPAESFDAVFVWNTFDQLADPRSVLQKCRGLLKAGGILVLRVPNASFKLKCLRLRQRAGWAEKVLQAEAENNFLTFPYLAGYTPDSLRKLVESCGFQVSDTKGSTLFRSGYSPVNDFVEQACRRRRERLETILFPWLEFCCIRPSATASSR